MSRPNCVKSTVRIAADPEPVPRVSRTVSRLSSMASALVLALGLGGAACGKDKKESTTPAATGSGQSGSVPGMDDRGTGPDDVQTPDGTGGGDTWSGGDGEPGDGDPGTEPGGDDEPAEARQVPPNLDLPEAEQKQKVKEHLTRARAALSGSNKDTDAAIRESKAALAADALNVEAVAVLALAYYHAGWIETAEETLETVFTPRDLQSSDPVRREVAKDLQARAQKNADIYYVYGLIYDSRGDGARAQLAYEAAVRNQPRHASALTNLGRVYLDNDLDAKAVEVYTRLFNELGIKTALVYNNLGAAYRGRAFDFRNDTGRYHQYLKLAEEGFKRAIQTDKGYGPAYFNLAVLYMDADGMPGADGKALDTLARLKMAQTYFDEYRKIPGADLPKLDDLTKTLGRAIKREQRERDRQRG
jgi:tetratricopeptide (TPR) repeat protein